jgi:hypothetical protein
VASCSRLLDVIEIFLISPRTAVKAELRRPSSIAHKTSVSRVVLTIVSNEVSSPCWTRPNGYRSPVSVALLLAHQRIRPLRELRREAISATQNPVAAPPSVGRSKKTRTAFLHSSRRAAQVLEYAIVGFQSVFSPLVCADQKKEEFLRPAKLYSGTLESLKMN